MNKWTHPQWYHAVGAGKVSDAEWGLMKKSDYYLRQPLLHEDRMRKQLRLIVNKHVGRLEAA